MRKPSMRKRIALIAGGAAVTMTAIAGCHSTDSSGQSSSAAKASAAPSLPKTHTKVLTDWANDPGSTEGFNRVRTVVIGTQCFMEFSSVEASLYVVTGYVLIRCNY